MDTYVLTIQHVKKSIETPGAMLSPIKKSCISSTPGVLPSIFFAITSSFLTGKRPNALL